MKHKATTDEPVYHGNDLEAAKRRAKEIKGVVIWSTAPGNPSPYEDKEWGYWSDDVGMLRTWERLEADYTGTPKGETV